MRNKILNKTKGFTLIEIMLVIGIVTLLASIAMFGMTEAKKKAQDAKMVVETKQVETAIRMYKDDKGVVPSPTTVSDSNTYTEDSPGYTEVMDKLVSEKYLSKIPESPDKQSYAYGVSSDKKSAMFVAHLKTRRSSNGGENSNDDSSDHCVDINDGGSSLCDQIPPPLPPLLPPTGTWTNPPEPPSGVSGSLTDVVELTRGEWLEQNYNKSTAGSMYYNISYSIIGGADDSEVTIWFEENGFHFTTGNNQNFICNGNGILTEGQTGYCYNQNSPQDSIEFLNYNNTNGILKIRAL